MLPLCTEYPASRKQMMTIDIETISGVPFTGLLNSTRPMTSAHTRKLRKECQQRCHRKQHMDQTRVDAVEHVEFSAADRDWRSGAGGAARSRADGYFTL